jgi:RNA polymerase sigma-70 factor (ECF subfamily)
MSLHHLSDHELWESILDGDQAAFSFFFRKHWAQVYATVFFYLKDQEACKEITHDIFLNIWLKRDHLKILTFPAYLKAAGRYHVYRYIRNARKHPIIYNEELAYYNGYTCSNHGDEQMVCKELEHQVDAYVSALPKRCREVFILSRKQHLSNDQIARKLGISKRTVENQITYALHHLRMLLKVISMWLF